LAIRTLFLDAGGVLVHPNWERVAEALSRQGIATPAEQLARAEPRARFALDKPAIVQTSDDASRGRTYFDLVLAEAGIVPPADRLRAAWDEVLAYHSRQNLWEVLSEDAYSGLERFRRAGLRLVVVSNANGTLHEHFDRLGLTQLVDCVIDSQVEGVEKPDPRIFRLALARAGAHAETTVHVGDLYHVDVVGARAAGLRAVLLDAADLYAGCDCTRVRSLSALADSVESGTL
jgi:putative hydrolase of the HAD superfamily